MTLKEAYEILQDIDDGDIITPERRWAINFLIKEHEFIKLLLKKAKDAKHIKS